MRYSECDVQGVVFNANYVAYFDVVITELWREAIGPYQELVDSGVDMVVGEINVRFLGSAAFDDDVTFEARVTRLGETAISTHIDASVDGRRIIEGEMRHVFIDPETKKKRAMPAHVRAGLAPYATDA